MFLLRRVFSAFQSDEDRYSQTPLKKVTFLCEVKDCCACTCVTQCFENCFDGPIECEYVFPVLEDAALARMTVTTSDGRVLEARVEEKEAAKEEFSDAISAGKQAAMGRLESEDRMVLSIGNLPAKGKVEVTFDIVQVVGCQDDKWLFTIPGALMPSIPGLPSDEAEESPTSVRFVLPEHCGYRMHLSLHIQAASEILAVSCLTHPLLISRSEASTNEVDLASDPQRGFLPGIDLKVIYHTAESMAPKVSVQYDPVTAEYCGMLSFLPPLLSVGELPEELTGYGEFLYILDRSGSMAGSRIDMAKQAALLFLKSLPPTSMFNIISFGSTIEPLFLYSQEYTSQNVAYALTRLSEYKADLGGTNILLPLEDVFRRAADSSQPRAVFLLTDGDVENPEAVIGFVEAHSRQARFFPFGIGREVSAPFLRQVATAGNGRAEFISHMEDIKSKVIGTLQKCIAPALSDLVAQWPAKVRQFPSNERVATCYFGEVFVVMALFGREKPQAGAVVIITAKNSKTREDLMLEVRIGDSCTEGNRLYKLWGKFALKELFFRERQLRDPELKFEIVELSKKCGLPTLYTSFICVQRDSDVVGRTELVKVPVACETDRRLMKRMTMMSTPMYRRVAFRSTQAVSVDYANRQYKSAGCCGGGGPAPTQRPAAQRDEPAFHALLSRLKPQGPPIGEGSTLMKLLALQQVDGSWFTSSLPDDFPDVRAIPAGLMSALGRSAEAVWATVCVLELLSLKYKGSEAEWKLIAIKAKKWLKLQGVQLEEITAIARELVLT